MLTTQVLLGLGASAALWWLATPTPPKRQEEDDYAHFGVVGLSRSGKTAWAILKLLEWQRRGWGWCWLSIKGGAGLLPYLPPEANVDLISPTSPRPRGINMLRLHTNSPQEREQVADQMAEVVDRLHPVTSDLMREMVRLGALALLEYSARTGWEVSLPDLYTFFTNEANRRQVLGYTKNPVLAQAFDSSAQKTLEAVQRQIRRLVSSRAIVLALGRSGPNQVDIRKAMATGRGIVVDASDTALGPGQAALINEVVASKVQMYTAQRKPNEPGFGVVADEAQEYQGAGHSFRRALALAAEYRVAWVLVNQYREGQLNAAMQAAVSLAGTHVFFRLAAGDAPAAVKTLGGAATAEQLVQLDKRHYWTVERIAGRTRTTARTTPDLPKPDPQTAHKTKRVNEQGPAAEAVLAGIYRTMAGGEARRLWS